MIAAAGARADSAAARARKALLDPGADRLWLIVIVLLGVAGGLGMIMRGLREPFAVQDDARQFLFWMAQWDDPSLFRGDLLADYWRSVSPWLFTGIYRIFHLAGVAPVDAALVLPVLLMPATAVFGYRFARALSGHAYPAFLAALCLLVGLVLEDVVISSTPRAFAPLFFLMFLDGTARRQPLVVAAGILGLTGTYPHAALVAASVLGLASLAWRNGPRLDLSLRNIALVCSGAAALVVGILPFLLAANRFGPAMTVATAADFPTFLAGGRGGLFERDGSIDFACGSRVGLVPGLGCDGFASPLLWLVLALALAPVIAVLVLRLRGKLPRPAVLPFAVAVAGFAWFFLAALLLFELHQPNRYTGRTIPYVIVPCIGILLGLALGRWLAARPRGRDALPLAVNGLVIAFFVALYVAAIGLIAPGYFQVWRTPELGVLLARTPLDTRVAGPLVNDLDFIPLLARRPVLFSYEHAIAYQLGYYRQIDARMRDVAAIQLTTDPADLAERLERNAIDLYLLPVADAETPSVSGKLMRFVGESYVRDLEAARAGRPSALGLLASGCTEARFGALLVLDAHCVVAAARKAAAAR